MTHIVSSLKFIDFLEMECLSVMNNFFNPKELSYHSNGILIIASTLTEEQFWKTSRKTTLLPAIPYGASYYSPAYLLIYDRY